MPGVCLIVLAHHAERLRHLQEFDVDDARPGVAVSPDDYLDVKATDESLMARATELLLPGLKLLIELVEDAGARLAFAPSGGLLRSADRHDDVRGAIERLASRHHDVELVASPWDRSLGGVLPAMHVTGAVRRCMDEIEHRLGNRPVTAVNVAGVYDDAIAAQFAAAGASCVLCGHADAALDGRTANRLYHAPGNGPRVMTRNVALSDDLALRTRDPSWDCHPLSPETYADWLAGAIANTHGESVPIFLHLADLFRDDDTVASMLQALPKLIEQRGLEMDLPRDVVHRQGKHAELLSMPRTTSSWSPGHDLSPWLGNAMQSNALQLLLSAHAQLRESEEGAEALSLLSAADHLGWMRYRPYDSTIRRQSLYEPADMSVVTQEQRRRPTPFDNAYDAYLDHTLALRHWLRR
ncbi:MAG: hypothetical protein AAGK78_02615, partial [Planctomycetota bacterium]